MPQVTIYTTPTCGYCRQAKDFFRQKGIQYVEKDVSVDTQAAYEMVRLSRQQGVPVIRVGDEVIVGFNRQRVEAALARPPAKPSLGLAVADASKIAVKHGMLPVFGAHVGRVRPGSAGERAGLRPGDIITEVNLRPVRNADDLEAAMQSAGAGGRVVVVWLRGEQRLRSEVML